MSDKKTPEIRFDGFTDDWEQREFGEVFSEVREKTIEENEDTLLSCAINGIFLNSELFKAFRGSSTTGYLKIKRNDLILSAQNLHLGNANINLKFESGIISPAYKVYDINSSNPNFMQAWVKKENTKKIFDSATTEGASVCRKNIEWSVLVKQNLSVPEIEEQAKIGKYFATLDNLITCHQRKYDQLQTVRKSMLEKMFPQNGAKVPEIRFDGFTDDWEQREAKEIFYTIADKGYPELPVLSATQEYGMVKRSVTGINIHHDKDNEVGYKRVQKGNFVMHLRSFQGGFAHSNVEGITSPAYTVLGFSESTEHNDYFWKYILSSESFIKRLELITYGIRDGRSINFSEFAEFMFYVPSCKEQNKIAEYFANLDKLITTHQRELDKLKNIKKSMLEKMFV